MILYLLRPQGTGPVSYLYRGIGPNSSLVVAETAVCLKLKSMVRVLSLKINLQSIHGSKTTQKYVKYVFVEIKVKAGTWPYFTIIFIILPNKLGVTNRGLKGLKGLNLFILFCYAKK